MLRDTLQSGLVVMQIRHDADQMDRLLLYLQTLVKWNRSYNLTAISDPERMVPYHLLDSLSLLPQLKPGQHCLDVGTGAGLPGIPLAIMLPDTDWVLLDSNGKKTRFVQQAVASCRLSNVKVVQSRVEDYHADSSFDIIVSRAYASVADFVASVKHLWQSGTSLVTMKTEPGEVELAALDRDLYGVEVIPITVPGIAEKRSLVTIQRH
jgi:16S rRNA (guanine527-N7)-methyltransferase